MTDNVGITCFWLAFEGLVRWADVMFDNEYIKQSSKKRKFTVDLTRWGSLRLAPIISEMYTFTYVRICQMTKSILGKIHDN